MIVMESTIDISDQSHAQRREHVFDHLDETAPGDTVVITTDRDIYPSLCQYRIKRNAELDWESEQTGPDSWEVQVTKTEASTGPELPVFDVRELPPQRRHTVLTDTFEQLDPDEGFVLVNDHDPKPLYHEFRSTYGNIIDWEYASRDQNEWRVEIVKTEATENDVKSDVEATFDVRQIPKQDRHPIIHHRYGNLGQGESMELIAPHEPRPLHQEFRQQYGDSFTWDVREQTASRCRVRIIKEPEQADEMDDSTDDALEVTTELDVRDLPPAERHEQIFDAYAQLESGEAFVLVNDHDPKPLYHQFEAETGPEFRWKYRLKDPNEFRVRIGKAEVAESDSTSASNTRTPF